MPAGGLDDRGGTGDVRRLLRDVGASHRLPLIHLNAFIERHDADVRLWHVEGQLESLARKR